MNNTYDLLDQYAKEIGIEKIYLETLISSHRNLRAEVMKSKEQRDAEFNSIREVVEKQTREAITHGEYIATRRLVKMTVSEFTEFISDYTERHE